MKIIKSLSLALTIAVGSLGATGAMAFDETSTASINVDQGVILQGYDAVAYQTESKPVKGDAQYSASYQGATYHFASAANRDAFRADPAKYAPAYGGFCAMGAALGKKLDIDPTQFKVVDGRLYLNVNADVFKKWSENVPGNIQNANANWPTIADKAPNSL